MFATVDCDLWSNRFACVKKLTKILKLTTGSALSFWITSLITCPQNFWTSFLSCSIATVLEDEEDDEDEEEDDDEEDDESEGESWTPYLVTISWIWLMMID